LTLAVLVYGDEVLISIVAVQEPIHRELFLLVEIHERSEEVDRNREDRC
jgi:hypothetical protein